MSAASTGSESPSAAMWCSTSASAYSSGPSRNSVARNGISVSSWNGLAAKTRTAAVNSAASTGSTGSSTVVAGRIC